MKRALKKDHWFVVCVNNAGYAASLEKGKIYTAIGDEIMGKKHLVQIIDESGEDYLYPQDFFLPIILPKPVEKALLLAS